MYDEHPADKGLKPRRHSRIELAVGESTGSALSKLNVGPGIDPGSAVLVAFGSPNTLLHRLSAFYQDGTKTVSGKYQCGEKPCRT